MDLEPLNTNIYPLLLPRCDEGQTGHFVLVIFETELESLLGPSGMLSDRQMLVKYNPFAQDDDSAVEKVQREWNFIITNPSQYYEQLMHDARYPEIYPDVKLAMDDFDKFGAGLAFEFKRECSFIISAIATLEREYHKPMDDEEWVTRLNWVHPHLFVRKALGNPLSDLEHNIAGVAYEM